MGNEVCKWRLSSSPEDDVWITECGMMFVFNVDGPKENNFVYCPYCGKELLPQKESE